MSGLDDKASWLMETLAARLLTCVVEYLVCAVCDVNRWEVASHSSCTPNSPWENKHPVVPQVVVRHAEEKEHGPLVRAAVIACIHRHKSPVAVINQLALPSLRPLARLYCLHNLNPFTALPFRFVSSSCEDIRRRGQVRYAADALRMSNTAFSAPRP
jgi:hypothetical protein